MEYQVGEKIDNQYVIVEKHHGGMSTVYVVRDEFSNKRFAVKTIREELASDAQAVQRFAEEGRTWMKLGRHPHIVEAIIYREIEGQPFLFLEYVEGGDLQNLLSREKMLFLPQLLDFAIHICAGMQYVHTAEISASQRGVIHRDLKPGNLMLNRQAEVKITDFGLAKVYGARNDVSQSGLGLGTYLYMPPEQFLDAASADERSDIYSFGVFLYTATTGQVPVAGKNLSELVHNILNRVPPEPRTLRPELPESMSRIIMKALARQRTDRYSSFAELGKALQAVRDEVAALPEWHVPVYRCVGCGYTTRFRYPLCPICASALTAQVWGETAAPAVGRAGVEREDATRVADQLYQQALQDEQAGRLEAALNSLRRAAALVRDDPKIVQELDRIAQLYRERRARERPRAYNWPTQNGNVTRNGFTPESVAPPLTLRWSANVGEWSMVSPVVANGVVFASGGSSQAGERGQVVALEAAKGQERWRERFPWEMTLTPLVSQGESLLVPNDRELHSLDTATGARRWTCGLGARLTGAPLLSGSTVFVGDEEGRLYALDATRGTIRWSALLAGGIFTPPALWSNRLFVGTAQNRLYCLNESDGSVLWDYAAGAEVTAGPALPGNLALFGCADHRVYCLLQSTGRLLWDFETQGEVHSTPALAGEAAVFGSRDGSLYCVELRTGSLRWEYRTGDWVEAAPAISENFIYCGGHDGVLRVLEAASGLSLWEYDLGEEVRAAAAVSGGQVFVATAAGRLCALRGR
ncbi:MAG TPA: serine/threonine-protein kinase [Armatimonadota bacterium]